MDTLRTAILVPSCEAYAPAARFTVERLDVWWPGHPEVFVCGLAVASASAFERSLPMAADPTDWVGIVRDAVGHLHEQGFVWLYLILDDHPPFGPCDADYLNRRLPDTAVALDAVQVNLQGWDQYQPQDGVVLGPERLCWQRNRPSFRWKFSLHPGFWHVLALRNMLESLRSSAPAVRTARQLEGALHGACERLDPGLLERTYRVRGDGFTARDRWFESRRVRSLTRELLRAVGFAAQFGGPRGVAAVGTAVLPYQRYVNGPYPMFWSGLLRHGRLHEEALRFLAWTGQSALADEIRRRLRAAG